MERAKDKIFNFMIQKKKLYMYSKINFRNIIVYNNTITVPTSTKKF